MDWKYPVMAITVTIIVLALTLVPLQAHGYEGPGYRVLKTDGKFEVRDYNGYVTAQVNVSSGYNGAMKSGFMDLFNYISGKNSDKSKIPMTAPVTSERSNNNEYTISFVMPAKYTLDTLPIPDNKNIVLKNIGPHKAAVISFSGRMNEELANKKISALREWLDKNDIKPKSNFLMAQYNAPWTPGFMRNNEIIVEI